MSRSKHARKPKNHSKRLQWYDYGGWILESSKQQRVRLKREVDKVLKDPDHEVILEKKGPKNSYDWP